MRTCKIANLPNKIREQLNTRLRDGEAGQTILSWLNSLPEVKSVLAKDFDSRPINKVNLSDWRSGGYSDWLIRQDALAFVQQIQDKHALGHDPLTDCIAAKLVQWVGLQYAASARAQILAEPDLDLKWTSLRQLCADSLRLRRAELAAERLQLRRESFEAEDMARDIQQKADSLERKLHIGLLTAAFKSPKNPSDDITGDNIEELEQHLEHQSDSPDQPAPPVKPS